MRTTIPPSPPFSKFGNILMAFKNISASFDTSAHEFLHFAREFILENEAENNLIASLALGVASGKFQGTGATYMRITEHNRLLAAALQTRPDNILLAKSSTPDCWEVLAKNLFDSQHRFSGVIGPTLDVEAFARHWCKLSRKHALVAMQLVIFRLDQVVQPTKSLGALKQAHLSDLAIVEDWILDFQKEALPNESQSDSDLRALAKNKVEAGSIYLLLVGNSAVSLAARSGETPNGARIGTVYTPKHLRKKGYASEITAKLSQLILDRGKKFCTLYTDKGNPTSNKIYQDIGYRPISESLNIQFTDPT